MLLLVYSYFRSIFVHGDLLKYFVYFIKNTWARTKIDGPPGAKNLVSFRPRKKFCLDAVRYPNTRTALSLEERSVMLLFTRSLQGL